MLFLNVSFMLGKKKNNIEIINGILENLTVLKIISQFYFSNFNLNILTYIYIYTYTQRMRPYLFWEKQYESGEKFSCIECK